MIELDKLYHPDDEDYLPFQRAGIAELVTRKNVLLGDEMGLGKTIQIIGYMNLTRPVKVLIVCPNNLRLNWLTELDKWLDPSLRAKHDIEQCTTGLFVPSDYVVASFEGMVKWHSVLKTVEWDLIVVDEAHYIKNASTKRAKALYEFQDIPCKKILATGTPICNYPYEIFPLIHFLDKEQWPSVTSFQRRYCPYGNKYAYHMDELQKFLRGGAPKRVVKPITRKVITKMRASDTTRYVCSCEIVLDSEQAAVDHISANPTHEASQRRVQMDRLIVKDDVVDNEVVYEQGCGLMVRRLKKEVLKELPRKRRQIIELPAEGELLRLVEEENALWKQHADLVKELEEALGTWSPETESDFEKIIESMKFNRQYMFTEISRIRHELAVAKVPYVIEHLEDILENKDKVVVFVHHNDVAEAIHAHFKEQSVIFYGPLNMEERHANVTKFVNNPDCTLFIASLKTAGVGLNLQVSSHMVFAELDWVPGVITQAEDRCHRIGQDKSLLVQHLVAQNSMDSSMAKRIIAKQKNIQKALNREMESV